LGEEEEADVEESSMALLLLTSNKEIYEGCLFSASQKREEVQISEKLHALKCDRSGSF
jgi:hypothetical protein